MMFENLELDAAVIKKLEKYMQIFKAYNMNINMMSKNDMDFLYEKHILDSLAFDLFYKKYYRTKSISLLDIGTGGGFPAFPIAICHRNIEVTAVDSVFKKINFLQYAKEDLKVKNIYPLCERIEDLTLKNSFEVCVSRAMAELRIMLEYAIPYLEEGGFFVAFKSVKADEEIAAAKNALNILNAQLIEKIQYTLPLKEMNNRVLVVIKKIGKTPEIYPRKIGMAVKKPL